MTRVLRKLRINEVSSVDSAASPGARITLMKRDSDRDETRERFAKIFQKHSRRPAGLRYLDKYHRPNLPPLKKDRGYITSDEADERARERGLFNDETFADQAEPPPNVDDEQDEQQLDEDEEGFGKSHIVSALADLLCEAGASEGVDRPAALRFLLHDARGNALVRRLHKADATNKREKENYMSDTKELAAIAKTAGGMEAICERIVTKGETNFSEHELVAAFSEGIVRKEGESREQAFARTYENSLPMRKAIAIAKGMKFGLGSDL
jgi:hypothetical protein